MSAAKKHQPQSKPLEHYLHESSSTKRIQILREIAQLRQLIPCSLVDDLLLVDLPISERLQLLKSCDRSDLLAFEDVMTRGTLNWEPNIAAVAIREWVKHSNHLLWWRFPEFINSKPAQRVLYTLLDAAAHTGGCSGKADGGICILQFECFPAMDNGKVCFLIPEKL